MIKYIVMNMGFAEECSIATLIFGLDYLSQSEGFSSKENALQSLAKDFYNKYCMECIGNVNFFTFEGYTQYVWALSKAHTDTYGESEFANNESLIWAPYSHWNQGVWSCGKQEILFLKDQAEHFLTLALVKCKPELLDVDSYVPPNWLEVEYDNLIKE